MTELFQITLGAGSSITLSSSTVATAVPEPSTMAIASLGSLGMIGYGLRRRKARAPEPQPVNLMARMSHTASLDLPCKLVIFATAACDTAFRASYGSRAF